MLNIGYPNTPIVAKIEESSLTLDYVTIAIHEDDLDIDDTERPIAVDVFKRSIAIGIGRRLPVSGDVAGAGIIVGIGFDGHPDFVRVTRTMPEVIESAGSDQTGLDESG